MTEATNNKKIVFTTAGTREEAENIASALVERKLAACVNVVAINSIYRWKGEVERATEHLLIIKTTAGAFERVRAAIAELSSYDLPECIQLPIEAGSQAYLNWIDDSVQ
jgi:periplasmic divalent cation tolerance protein